MLKLQRIALLASIAVVGCNDNDDNATVTPSSVPAALTVIVGPNGTTTYSPMTININVGDTVTWQWAGGPHTVTSGVPGSPDGKFCNLPPGAIVDANTCNSTAYAISSGTYAHRFDLAGTYPYYCTIHGAAMTGTVVVGPLAAVDMGVAPGPVPTAPKTVNVAVGPGNSLTFAPAAVDINAGDTVTWTWMSASIQHTVTSGVAPSADGNFCSNGGAASPGTCSGTTFAATAPFTYSHTFPMAGTFPYFCAVHGAAMTGSITVH